MGFEAFDSVTWTYNSGDGHHDLNFFLGGSQDRIVSFADDSLSYYKVEDGFPILLWDYRL